MQDKITRWPVGSLQHTLQAIGLCQILAHEAHPADRGVLNFPADFPFIHHRMVGFCLITAFGPIPELCYHGVALEAFYL